MITLKIDTVTTDTGTDTDGLTCEIKNEDIYEDFSKDKEMLDFSKYYTGAKYYDYWIKLVVGNMKDEIGSIAINEFAGLKSKMYSFLVHDNSEQK